MNENIDEKNGKIILMAENYLKTKKLEEEIKELKLEGTRLLNDVVETVIEEEGEKKKYTFYFEEYYVEINGRDNKQFPFAVNGRVDELKKEMKKIKDKAIKENNFKIKRTYHVKVVKPDIFNKEIPDEM